MEGLYCILAGAMVMDIFTHRICNALMAAGLVTGLVDQLVRAGPIGLINSAGSALLIFIILYPLYLLKGLGAGDNKLFCVIAAYLGWRETIQIIGIALILGIFLWLICQIISMLKDKNKYFMRSKKRDGKRSEITGNVIMNNEILKEEENCKNKEESGHRFCFSPAIVLAVMIWNFV